MSKTATDINLFFVFTEMTRKAWTTDSQEEWLKAHQDKTLAKEFFPLVIKEFREQWPVPPLTSEETAAGPTVEQATKNKRNKYDQVCSLRR